MSKYGQAHILRQERLGATTGKNASYKQKYS